MNPYGPHDPTRARWDPQRPEPEYGDEWVHRKREALGTSEARGFYRVDVWSALSRTWRPREHLHDARLTRAVTSAGWWLSQGSVRARVVDVRTGDVVWSETRTGEGRP